MNDTDETRDPVELLAEQFVEQCRRGEHPSVSEYAAAYPAYAEQIRQVFPTLLALEDFKSDQDTCASLSGKLSRQSEIQPDRLGDFRILRTIGQGGMGVVYEAEQESLGRRVAIKVLAASYASSPRALQRFRREAQAAARLHHSNIVSVFGVGEYEGRHFYVMQHIEGRSLDQIIVALSDKHRVRVNVEHPYHRPGQPEGTETTEFLRDAAVVSGMYRGKFEPSARLRSDRLATDSLAGEPGDALPSRELQSDPLVVSCDKALPKDWHALRRKGFYGAAYWRSVAGIGTQVASALHYAHRQGVLHRDIKPGNLILDDNGIAWITDFGLAKLADQEDLTHPGDAVGTLRYMAPEQLEGQMSAKSDVYSLGLTLYELLTLRPAFDEASRHRLLRQVGREEPPHPRTINTNIPRDLETIVLKAIAREPARRYETAGELADDLQRFLDGRPIHARRVTTIEHAWRWCRRNPVSAGLVVAIVALVVLSITGASLGYFRESRLRIQAESSQRRAEANLAIAAKAFDDVFARISGTAGPHTLNGPSDSVWLGDTGNFPLTKKDASVLEGLLKFYEQFAQKNRNNAQWQYDTAKAYRRVGDIQQRLGRLDKASEAYQRSLKAYEHLPENSIHESEHTVELAATHNQLGNIAIAADQFDDASKQFNHARQLLTADADAAASANGRYELAKVYRSLGLLAIIKDHLRLPSNLRSQEIAEAEATIRQAIRILSDLDKENPSKGIYRMALAECHVHLCGLYRLTEHKDEASRHKKEATGILEQLLVESPSNPEYRHVLARLYVIMSGAPFADHSDMSIKSLQQAAVVMEEVVASHPDVSDYRGTLAFLYGAIAEVQLRDNENNAAGEKSLKRSIELLTRLNKESLQQARYRGLLAKFLYTLAVLQNHQGQPQAAKESLERIVDLIGATASGDSTSSVDAMLLAHSYTGLADVLSKIGEITRAREAANKARELWSMVPSSFRQGTSSALQDPWTPDRLPKSTEDHKAPPVKSDSTPAVPRV